MADSKTDSDVLREIRSKFVGKWQLTGSENFEAFLEEMGAPYLIRKMARLSKPDCEISIIDDKIRIHTTTTFMSQEDIFEFDKDYENNMMRTKMKCHVKYEDGKIIQTMIAIDGSKKPAKNTRHIEDENMILTFEVGDVVSKRIFGRVN